MNKFERMIERFQLLIDIEYDEQRVARAVRRSARQAAGTRVAKPEQNC